MTSYLQYLLPHHLLSALMHAIARVEWAPLKDFIISRVVDIYDVDLSSAREENPKNYASFNAFFTRQLKAEARPVAEGNIIVSPVDGTVSQAGDIRHGRIFQAKQHSYSLTELLGGKENLAKEFENGKFATIYLSPRDYHRIHMPADGKLREMTHVPGRLFSVSPETTRAVSRLFARNERLINLFDSDNGPFAVIMVGAIFVSSMDTVWEGTVTPRRQQPTSWHYNQQQRNIELAKGEEMGRFNMGSTVILLFPENSVDWMDMLAPGSKVQMGQAITDGV
ncbi:MAG: phosphatidylserine decarboxylase [Gammaproteobacteria bacterium]|nr:phosphatidylserine decarboxylase [Gammaproteobacteria bacterium]NNJ92055.1 phosphatidylserine decarboxylase [Gammaproteobacteria bacterium]